MMYIHESVHVCFWQSGEEELILYAWLRGNGKIRNEELLRSSQEVRQCSSTVFGFTHLKIKAVSLFEGF